MTGLITQRSERAAVRLGTRKFRPDIEGMRAIAIVLVVLYHSGVPVMSGGYVGVDVFFVISGFLITRQLVREVTQTGKLSIAGFYARRMRRLLPASTVVLLATLIAARVWLPVLQLKSLIRDVLFTVVYAMNYHLAAAKTNYLNAGAPPSPLQHYWSLAVEEQFYFIWPLLILLVAVLAKRRRLVVLTAVLLVLAAGSLVLSIVTTTPTNSVAYFAIHTRAWELAVGALVAVTATGWARLPAAAGAVVAWCGIGMIAISSVTFSDATAFPGSAALLPVVGAALVIGAGCAELRTGPERILRTPPVQVVGKLSYSWYLWHWPALLLAPAAFHRTSFPVSLNLIVALISLGLAAITYIIIETPTRSLSMPRHAWIATGVGLSSIAAVAALVVSATLPSLQGRGPAVTLPPVAVAQTSPTTVPSAGQYTAAALPSADEVVVSALETGLQAKAVPSNLTPTLDKARVDSPAATFDGCHEDYLATAQGPCVYGDPNGTRTVVLFGDSHMEQWLPAFDIAGKADHWKVVNWTKATCPLVDVTVFSVFLDRSYPECDTWKAVTIARIAALHPDLVFAGAGDDDAGKPISDSVWVAGTVATLQKLKQAVGAPIVYFEDTPFSQDRGPACVAAHLSDVRPCDFPVDTAYPSATRHVLQHQAVLAAGFPTVDPIKWLCTQTMCPVIVGNLLVYRDFQHISASYSRWLAPAIQPLLETDWQ